jgi:hypothetical protein
MVQQIGALKATTHAFAPQGLEAGGFVLALALENTGGQAIAGVEAFSLHNFHLGFGRPQRPWDVRRTSRPTARRSSRHERRAGG